MADVIKKQLRSTQEFERDGFKQYPRKKMLVLARKLPAEESPMEIKTAWGETLLATTGYMICYESNAPYRENPHEYEHWPVEPDIFEHTYRPWDEVFSPSKVQQQLINIGCKPYYKATSVRAKLLTEDVYIQSLEHEKPVLVPKDRVLAIGSEGEPYHMGDETFHDRYDGTLEGKKKGFKKLLDRLVGFFK